MPSGQKSQDENRGLLLLVSGRRGKFRRTLSLRTPKDVQISEKHQRANKILQNYKADIPERTGTQTGEPSIEGHFFPGGTYPFGKGG